MAGLGKKSPLRKRAEGRFARASDLKRAAVVVAAAALVWLASQALNTSPRMQPFASAYITGEPARVDYAGQVTLLDFWYPSCPSCRADVEALNDIDKLYRDSKLKIVSVSLNANSLDEVKKFSKDFGFERRVVYDQGGALSAQFGIQYAPTYLLIDAQGDLVYRKVGRFNALAMKAKINEQLAKIPS